MYNLIDEGIAEYLECSVEDYIHYVEKVCNENEREMFLDAICAWLFFAENEEEAKKMKNFFCRYNNN